MLVVGFEISASELSTSIPIHWIYITPHVPGGSSVVVQEVMFCFIMLHFTDPCGWLSSTGGSECRSGVVGVPLCPTVLSSVVNSLCAELHFCLLTVHPSGFVDESSDTPMFSRAINLSHCLCICVSWQLKDSRCLMCPVPRHCANPGAPGA